MRGTTKKLNDRVDLDLHQMLSALAKRVRVPRAVVVNRLLRLLVNHAHHGDLIFTNGEWRVWPAAERMVAVGMVGRPTKLASDRGGQRLGAVDFDRPPPPIFSDECPPPPKKKK